MAGSSIMGGSNIPLERITNGSTSTPENLQEVALVKGKIYRDRDTGLFHYCHTARPATSGVLDVAYLDLTPASIESLSANKFNKGAVSVDYDNAKKIEDKIETLSFEEIVILKDTIEGKVSLSISGRLVILNIFNTDSVGGGDIIATIPEIYRHDFNKYPGQSLGCAITNEGNALEVQITLDGDIKAYGTGGNSFTGNMSWIRK